MIRVGRSLMTRESYPQKACNDSEGYSKDVCLKRCFAEKCLLVFETCQLFLPLPMNVSLENMIVKGFDTDFCYMMAFYGNGVDPRSIEIYRLRYGNSTEYRSDEMLREMVHCKPENRGELCPHCLPSCQSMIFRKEMSSTRWPNVSVYSYA